LFYLFNTAYLKTSTLLTAESFDKVINELIVKDVFGSGHGQTEILSPYACKY
jgi:hypothetical protein